MSNVVPISDVRDSVRDFYAARALNNETCCSPTAGKSSAGSCCSANPFHDEQLLDGIPDDIASFTLGCGDAVSLANIQPGETVIDLGSGGGLECFIAAKQTGEKGRVIGVDMTPEMLSKAWANAAKLKTTNVDFRHGYLEALPLSDNIAGVIMSNCVINLSPDKPRVFREAMRVLKPGGRIFVSDIVLQRHLPWFLRRSTAMYSACIAGALREEDYLKAMADAGFENITVNARSVYSLEHLVADPQVSRVTRLLLSVPWFRRMAEGITSLGVSATRPLN